MAFAIRNGSHHVPARPETLQQRLRQFDIRELPITINVINLAALAFLYDELNPLAVIINMYPAANILAVPIQRDLQSVQQISHEQRDDFLRKLIRAVIIAAPRDADIKPVGSGKRPRHQITTGFRRGIRRIWLQARILSPRSGRQAAVHLVRGYLDDARHPRIHAGLQQRLNSRNVCSDKAPGTCD
jgi:hypothetical protein